MVALDLNGGLKRSRDEGVGEVAHPEAGHHVLEHGSGPGEQRGAALDEYVRAIEAEPGLLGDVSLGDGDEGGDAGLGGEEVVAGGVELMSCAVVADGEELAGFDEEEAVLHGISVAVGLGGDGGDVGPELGEMFCSCGEQREQLGSELDLGRILQCRCFFEFCS